MSAIVNPVTEWAGGSNLVIVGHECPECGAIEYDHLERLKPDGGVSDNDGR